MSDLCRSCNAPIMWRHHIATNKPNPLDAAPSPTGNVRLLGSAKYETVKPGDIIAAQAAGEVLYVSHFATCPNRRQHRKAD